LRASATTATVSGATTELGASRSATTASSRRCTCRTSTAARREDIVKLGLLSNSTEPFPSHREFGQPGPDQRRRRKRLTVESVQFCPLDEPGGPYRAPWLCLPARGRLARRIPNVGHLVSAGH